MKKYWFYVGVLAMVLLVITACTPVQKAPVERRVGDPTGRILNTALSCVGHCTDFKSACPDIAG